MTSEEFLCRFTELVRKCHQSTPSRALAHTICKHIYLFLSHGLRNQSDLWKCIMSVAHACIVNEITGLSWITNDVGRCQTFIRISLNENTTSCYVQQISEDSGLVGQYYGSDAYMADCGCVGSFLESLTVLNQINFSLDIEDHLLNVWNITGEHLGSTKEDESEGQTDAVHDSADLSTGEDHSTECLEGCGADDGESPQPSLKSGAKDGESYQPSLKNGAEVGESSQKSLKSDGGSPQQSLKNGEEDGGSPQQSPKSGAEDEGSPQLPRNSGSEESPKPPRNSRSIVDSIVPPQTNQVGGDVDSSLEPGKRDSADEGTDRPQIPDYQPIPPRKASNPPIDDFDSLRFKIAPERGIFHQGLGCHSCKKAFYMESAARNLHPCHFDGMYYCSDCMSPKKHKIPSRIVFNWDFTPYPVCLPAADYLDSGQGDPVYNINELNPDLLKHFPPLQEVVALRVKLSNLFCCISFCDLELTDRIVSLAKTFEHFLYSPYIFSLADFELVRGNRIARRVRGAIQVASNHVDRCKLCSQRGFICGICGNGREKILLTMHEETQCKSCHYPLHLTCVSSGKVCRCRRIDKSSSNFAQYIMEK